MIFPTRDNQEPPGQVILPGLRPSCSDTHTHSHTRASSAMLQLCPVSEFTSTQYTGCDASDDFPERLWQQRCDEHDEERDVKSVPLSVLTIHTLSLD